MVDRFLTQKVGSMRAPEGLIGYSDFLTRPIERVVEFVEVVPGIVVTLMENDSISYRCTMLVNIFDSRAYDIAHLYSSRTLTESSAVEDIRFHPVNPRSLRFNAEYKF